MSERIRITHFEAEDAHRIIREYVGRREALDSAEVEEIIEDMAEPSDEKSTASAVDQIVALADTEYLGDVNTARVEDLVNAIGEIYENALARKGPAKVDAAHGGR